MRFSLPVFALFCGLAVPSAPTFACDICAIATGSQAVDQKKGSLHLGVSQQFSEIDKIQRDGREIENPQHERLSSFITQLYAAYDVQDRLSLQLTIPLINRRYRTVVDGTIERGTEAGLGDIAALARYSVFTSSSPHHTVKLALFAGIKMPTGESNRLRHDATDGHHDESGEDHASAGEHGEDKSLARMHPKHAEHEHRHDEERPTDDSPSHQPEEDSDHLAGGAIHGHDLTLGTGSLDFPLGVSILAQRGRWLLTAQAQYVLRGEGRAGYQFANDLTYSVAPAYYLALDDGFTVAAGVHASGEWKEKDTLSGGVLEPDTGIHSIFLGPTLAATIGDDIAAELALDLPVDIDNSGTQAVPSYRMRAGISMRF